MAKSRRMMSALRGQQVSSHVMNGTLMPGIALGMRVSHGSLYRPLHACFNSQDHGTSLHAERVSDRDQPCCRSVFVYSLLRPQEDSIR
jgi:hypothetical protein